MTDDASPELALGTGVDEQNPWPGLVAFTESLQKFFYGRADEADDLLRRVGRKNLTVLFGQSGLGKSSLLQAGLFPRLRAEGYTPVSIRLDHAPSSPPLSEQVTTAVTRAIIDAGGRSEESPIETRDTLWAHFHRRSLILQTADGRAVRPALVFDQFEELFAIGQASEESRSRASVFLTELADFIENRAPETLEERLENSPELVRQFIFDDRDYRVLICLREDYLAHLESLRQSMPSITENRMRLTRMNGTRALEAVTNPGGPLIAPDVAEQVVQFVAGGRRASDGLASLEVEPSLLSLVCRELNNRRLAMGLPQITALLLAGNRDRILQDFYERCVADQPPAVRAFVEDELVTDSGLRENIALERARKSLVQRGAAPGAIDELVKRRLLHLEDRLDIQRVELTHDVLTSVVKKSRDERHQKEAEFRAEEQAKEVREKARRQRRRGRFVFAGMAAALVIVGGFGVASYLQFRVSQERLREAVRQRARAEKGEQEARQARAEAVTEKERAEANEKLADKGFEESRGTVDELLTEMSQEGLKDVPGLQELRQRFALKAVSHYAVFLARRPDDPAVLEGHARSLTALGAITGQVGSVEKAVATLQEAIKVHGRLLAKDPKNLEYQFELAQTRFELGSLFGTLGQMRAAEPHLLTAKGELEGLVRQKPEKLDYGLALSRTENWLGNVVEDIAQRKRYYEMARTLAKALCDRHPDDPRCVQRLMAPIGNLASSAMIKGDYAKALELEEESMELVESARRRSPQAPWLLEIRGLGYDNKARTLIALKRLEDATKCYQESIASFRSAAKENPAASRFRWLMAYELKNWALHLSSLGKYQEAKSCYEESCEILDALTSQVNDRPMYGAALIESWMKLASFYQGSTGDKSDALTQQQGRLRCLDQAIQIGHRLSKKFPEDAELHYQLADALHSRAAYESESERNKEAYPFYAECVDVFTSRVCARGRKPTEIQLGLFLTWTESAQRCAQDLKRDDEVLRLAQAAFDLGKACSAREGIQALGSIISRSGNVHKEAGRYKDAILVYSRALEIRRAAFEKAPWHWYLRYDIADNYKALAECYEKTGESQSEAKAWREYLSIWSGPMHGMQIADYVDPSRPLDMSETVRLRDYGKSTPGIRRFTIPCIFSGLRYPFHVYVTNVPWPKDPLEDQARWLLEERGGTIPEDVRELFRKTHKTAHENNVSFMDLATSNLGKDPAAESKKEDLNKTKKKLLAEIAALIDPQNKKAGSASQPALETAYEQLAATHDSLGELKDAIQACLRAEQLAVEMQRLNPNDVTSLWRVVRTQSKLGVLYRDNDVKEYVKSYAAYQRAVVFLEQLSSHKEAFADAQASLGIIMRVLGYLSNLAFTPTEAARWYWKAIELNDPESAAGLASVYVGHPEVAAILTEETRRALLFASEQTKNDPRTFPRLFAKEIDKIHLRRRDERIAQLRLLAGQHHERALGFQAKGARDDYRKALNTEFETRGEEVQIDPSNSQLKRDQANVARELARSYLDAKEMDKAVEWTTRAAELLDPESLLQLADWHDKAIHVPRDPEKADQYRSQAYIVRGRAALLQGRYEDALPDLKKASQSRRAGVPAFDLLGLCCSRLGRWDDAVTAYSRSIELDLKTDSTVVVLGLLQGLSCAERPEQLLEFIEGIEKKGWKLPLEGPQAADYNALFHGFRTIALRMSGKDALEAERAMRQYTSKPGFKVSIWDWNQLNNWLKTTKIAPDRKAAVEKIVGELLGSDRFNVEGSRLFQEGRYEEALADWAKVCESAQATWVDHNNLAMCLGKLGRWDDAIKSYTRGIELDITNAGVVGVVINLLEALTCAERPEQLLEFVKSIDKKGWKLPADDAPAGKYNAFFFGFQAMALLATGKDATEAEGMMRRLIAKRLYKDGDWTWDELNGWLKTTRIAPDRKRAVEKIIAELKGSAKTGQSPTAPKS
jgi:tetratricopeptide (TPR) repeat protein